MSTMAENVKIVVVGDGGVGKTALLISYTENTFPEKYMPTVFDNYTAGIDFNGRLLTLSLWDTAGQEEYSRLRALSYPDSNLFIICFAVNMPHSFSNVKEVWYPEVQHHCPDAKILLVGLKSDLRTSDSVPEQEAVALARSFGTQYCECSAKTQEGLHKVFETGLEIVLTSSPNNQTKRRKPKCSLL